MGLRPRLTLAGFLVIPFAVTSIETLESGESWVRSGDFGGLWPSPGGSGELVAEMHGEALAVSIRAGLGF